MCAILRKDIWSYWTVLMAWLKLITWRHWQFHLALLNHITWLYWTVSPGVTGPYHLTLLDSFTWGYWTASPGVTGQFQLSLQDRIIWRYWTVSLVITEPAGQFHLALLKLSPDLTGQQTSCSICNAQPFNLRMFLKMIAINMTNFSMT